MQYEELKKVIENISQYIKEGYVELMATDTMFTVFLPASDLHWQIQLNDDTLIDSGYGCLIVLNKVAALLTLVAEGETLDIALGDVKGIELDT